ncbi:MAG: DUF4329 domain-containing protein [Hasllibacter sp.]
MKTAIAALLAALLALPAAAREEPARDFKRVLKLLGQLNERSFTESREYCGALGTDAGGREVHMVPWRGTNDSCGSGPSPEAWRDVIDYHTHGSFDPGYMNEVPSTNDVQYTLGRGNPHYLGTPGGRVWRIDPRNGVSLLICGPRCIPTDPNYREGDHRPVRRSYTLRELEARFAEN